MNIVLDLRAIYGHFAGTPFIQPRLVSVKTCVLIACFANACTTPNLPTNIVDFKGLDSSAIFISKGGILMSIGNLPESLSQAMLVGIMLVGRLGVALQDFFRAHLCSAAALLIDFVPVVWNSSKGMGSQQEMIQMFAK